MPPQHPNSRADTKGMLQHDDKDEPIKIVEPLPQLHYFVLLSCGAIWTFNTFIITLEHVFGISSTILILKRIGSLLSWSLPRNSLLVIKLIISASDQHKIDDPIVFFYKLRTMKLHQIPKQLRNIKNHAWHYQTDEKRIKTYSTKKPSVLFKFSFEYFPFHVHTHTFEPMYIQRIIHKIFIFASLIFVCLNRETENVYLG